MVHIYFGQEKFQATKVTYTLLGATGILSLLMLPSFTAGMTADRKWWAPVVLEMIVAHCAVYIQLAIDACTWTEKLRKWQIELQFSQQYPADLDVSETALRGRLASFLINQSTIEATEDMLETQENASIACRETHKLTAGLYQAAFTALMNDTKKEYKLMESQQVDVLWRTIFAWIVTMGFSVVLAYTANLDPVVEKPTEVHVALFFTVLLLHVTCLPMARDGLAMMKYAMLHAEEFAHPQAAFLLGFLLLTAMFVAEVVNVLAAAGKTAVGDAVAGYIGFKTIIDLANIYMNSHEEFPMKGAVGTLKFKRGSKEEVAEPIGAGWLGSLYAGLFKIYYVFYKSVFFYFFPFAASFIPFIFSLEENFQ